MKTFLVKIQSNGYLSSIPRKSMSILFTGYPLKVFASKQIFQMNNIPTAFAKGAPLPSPFFKIQIQGSGAYLICYYSTRLSKASRWTIPVAPGMTPSPPRTSLSPNCLISRTRSGCVRGPGAEAAQETMHAAGPHLAMQVVGS